MGTGLILSPSPQSLLGRGGRRLALRCRRVEIRAHDLLRLEDLEHVAFLHVVEALEEDAALEALLHFTDVVLEALELRDRRLVDDGAVADDAHLTAAADGAAGDHAA